MNCGEGREERERETGKDGKGRDNYVSPESSNALRVPRLTRESSGTVWT